ncbi:hypothetical protein GYA28_03230 [Candidatus Roizmanbacteria bacterium]|jgi:hypothetical protein|nr:hypothetical protein [Candidatus Roizmanbacteria bacterium]
MTRIKSFLIARADLVGMEQMLPALAFLIPLFISGPQWLTGTTVNCLLFLTSTRLSKKNLYLVTVLPSLGALTHGLLFGTMTKYLIYMIPFIWAANFILIWTFSRLLSEFDNVWIAVLASSLTKSVFLYGGVAAMFGIGLVPKLFIASMGIVQLYTSLSGGLLSLAIERMIKKYE